MQTPGKEEKEVYSTKQPKNQKDVDKKTMRRKSLKRGIQSWMRSSCGLEAGWQDG